MGKEFDKLLEYRAKIEMQLFGQNFNRLVLISLKSFEDATYFIFRMR